MFRNITWGNGRQIWEKCLPFLVIGGMVAVFLTSGAVDFLIQHAQPFGLHAHEARAEEWITTEYSLDDVWVELTQGKGDFADVYTGTACNMSWASPKPVKLLYQYENGRYTVLIPPSDLLTLFTNRLE